MIKEFEPPFLYKTPFIIEEKIKQSSENLFKNKIRFAILFLLFNGYFITSYINKKIFLQLFKETLIISPVIFCLFFYNSR